MDSQDNKRKWKNRDLLSSLDFALTGIFTAFSINIAEHVAVEGKLPVAVFSMEMGGAQLVINQPKTG